MKKNYNQKLISRARSMRREMTRAELHLWLDCLKSLPYKFRRQRPFGNFIVDFYCAELKLIIEVDGDSHFSDQEITYDAKRTQYLESLGLRVLRFTNTEVFENLDGIRERILEITQTPSSLRATPPTT